MLLILQYNHLGAKSESKMMGQPQILELKSKFLKSIIREIGKKGKLEYYIHSKVVRKAFDFFPMFPVLKPENDE